MDKGSDLAFKVVPRTFHLGMGWHQCRIKDLYNDNILTHIPQPQNMGETLGGHLFFIAIDSEVSIQLL